MYILQAAFQRSDPEGGANSRLFPAIQLCRVLVTAATETGILNVSLLHNRIGLLAPVSFRVSFFKHIGLGLHEPHMGLMGFYVAFL